MSLTIQEAMTAKHLIYYDYGTPKKITLTGRYLEGNILSGTLLEYKTGLFGRGWVRIGLLEIVKEYDESNHK